MALMTFKPTSPGRRTMVRVVTPGLHKGAPHAALVEKQGNSGGRNHHGRITTRHIGGGHKQHYRIIDFKRDKEGIAARVERIEYDPNRTAHIALLCYVDGERRYIIAPKGLKAGDQVIAGRDAPIKAGNTLPENLVLLDARTLQPVKTLPARTQQGQLSRVSAVYDAAPLFHPGGGIRGARAGGRAPHRGNPHRQSRRHDAARPRNARGGRRGVLRGHPHLGQAARSLWHRVRAKGPPRAQ